MRLELTRRGDYGVRAMLALAEVSDADPPVALSVRRIAAAMAVPPQILPSVMTQLVRAGLVEAREGRGGGYTLAQSVDAIPILAVIEAIEGDTRRQHCVLRGGPCGTGGLCAVHHVFIRAEERLRGELEGATLADVRPTRSAS